MRQAWTEEDTDVVRQYRHLSAKEIQLRFFPNRTPKSVQRKKDLLRGEDLLNYNQPITPEDYELVRKHIKESNLFLSELLQRGPDQIDKIRHSIKHRTPSAETKRALKRTPISLMPPVMPIKKEEGIKQVVYMDNHILINGDHTAGLKYLRDQGIHVDLIVEDPDYRDIGKNLSTDHYAHIRALLKNQGLLLHYTYNANGSGNCREAQPHILIDKLKDKQFRFKSQIFWNKYFGQKLKQTKTSWSKTAIPTDIDILTILIKGDITYPSYVDLSKLHKGSGMILHSANQNEQFKPKPLCDDILLSLTAEKCVVVDTYMGGGNLALSALDHNRIYIGIESNTKLFNTTLEAIKIQQQVNMLKILTQ